MKVFGGDLWIDCALRSVIIPLKLFRALTVFIRQNLKYKDGPRAQRNKIFLVIVDQEMNQEVQTKTFLMISNRKSPVVSMF